MNKYLLIIFFLIIHIPGIDAYGLDVLSINSRDVDAYNKSLEGFKSVVKADYRDFVFTGDDEEIKKIIYKSISTKKPDIILAIGRDSMLALQDRYYNIPVVYCMVMYPEKLDLDKFRNKVTGVTLKVPINTQISTMKAIMPKVKTLGVVYDPMHSKAVIKEAREVSKRLGVDLVIGKINSRKAVPNVVRKIINKIDAFWLIPDATIISVEAFEFLHLITLEKRMPLIAFSEGLVKNGALASLAADYYNMGIQAADLAKRILTEKKPKLPLVVDPCMMNFSINITVANRIGVDIPPAVLNAANKIFE